MAVQVEANRYSRPLHELNPGEVSEGSSGVWIKLPDGHLRFEPNLDYPSPSEAITQLFLSLANKLRGANGKDC